MQRLQPLENAHFGLKVKISKNKSKSILQTIQSCFLQKTFRKNTKYSRNENIFKVSHHAKAIASAKSSLWLKNQNCQKHVKIHSTNRLEWFCKKIARKNAKYSRNETIFKMRHHAKAIAFYKILVMAQKLKFQKTCQNPFHKSFRIVLCKKPLENTRNIPEMRPFSKWAIMQRLQSLQHPPFG